MFLRVRKGGGVRRDELCNLPCPDESDEGMDSSNVMGSSIPSMLLVPPCPLVVGLVPTSRSGLRVGH